MQKLKTFLYSFYNSLINPNYYNDLLNVSSSFSKKYFVFLCFLVTYPVIIISSIIIVPDINQTLNNGIDMLVNEYPADLIISINENSEVSINKPQPYAIPLFFDAQELNNTPNQQPLIKNLVVFDSNANATDFTKYQTISLVTKDAIVVQSDNQIRLIPLKNEQGNTTPFSISRSEIFAIGEQVKTYVPYVRPIIIGGALIGGILFWIMYTLIMVVSLLLSTLIVYTVAVLSKKEYTFKEIYKLSLHFSTLAILINTASMISGYVIPVPYWFTLITSIMGIIVLFNLQPKPRPEELN